MKLTTKTSRVLLAVVAALVAAGTALAAQRALTLEMLCRGAERIVVGEVVGSAVMNDEWPGTGRITFTDWTIRIADRWKGPADGDTLTVRVPGGIDPETGITLTVSETPTFRLGEKVLVFAKEMHCRPWVFGWSQGKYEVVVERVVGRPGNPIAEDTLLPPLRMRVQAILRAQEAAGPGHGDSAPGGGR